MGFDSGEDFGWEGTSQALAGAMRADTLQAGVCRAGRRRPVRRSTVLPCAGINRDLRVSFKSVTNLPSPGSALNPDHHPS